MQTLKRDYESTQESARRAHAAAQTSALMCMGDDLNEALMWIAAAEAGLNNALEAARRIKRALEDECGVGWRSELAADLKASAKAEMDRLGWDDLGSYGAAMDDGEGDQ